MELALTPEVLEAFLVVLRENGVSNFNCPLFSAVLLPTTPEMEQSYEAAIKEASRSLKQPVAKGIYNSPALWPDGKPAAFPGSST